MKSNIVIIGGGTFNHVRNHLSLSAPAFGATAKKLHELFTLKNTENKFNIELKLTKMADSKSDLVTNYDVAKYVDKLIEDKNTRAIIFNVALTDFEGTINDVASGKNAERLETKNGTSVINITPSEKIIGRIRKLRKDIFVVGFKTTTNQDSIVQYNKGLALLKKNSLNLVLANDTVTYNNMIIAPEETKYSETVVRNDALSFLVKMTLSRINNHFTRSTVVEGELIEWSQGSVYKNLFEVVNHCIKSGAYKEFLGKTAGHFAAKLNSNEIITSIRKTNFNNLKEVGLVKCISNGPDLVTAIGAKPSVGGQSQRTIFKDHKDVDCIVHFHCPPLEGFAENGAVAPQWANECGSHECGQNTSKNLKLVDLGDGDSLKVVYLDGHGPNIVFNKNTPSNKVIDYINKNFDLKNKTGGIFA